MGTKRYYTWAFMLCILAALQGLLGASPATASSDRQEERDIRELHTPAPAQWRTSYLIASGAACCLLALVVLRQRRREGRGLPVPSRPPQETAYESLDAVAGKGLAERGEWRAYYGELADIMRTYLSGRFGVAALHLTTDELAAVLSERAPDSVGRLRGVGERCDGVKFGCLIPTYDEAAFDMRSVRELIRMTKDEAGPHEI